MTRKITALTKNKEKKCVNKEKKKYFVNEKIVSACFRNSSCEAINEFQQ